MIVTSTVGLERMVPASAQKIGERNNQKRRKYRKGSVFSLPQALTRLWIDALIVEARAIPRCDNPPLATERGNHRKSYILMDQNGCGELVGIHEEAQRLLWWNGSIL
jgi:hypothetical protein